MDTQTPETPNPETHAAEQNQIAQPINIVTTKNDDKLALWSMILGIISVVLAVVIFISIPAAIAAIIIGIVTLAKHRPGRTKSLTGIVTGGFALFVLIPLSIYILSGAADIARTVLISKEPTATATQVITDCYTYTIPSSYVYEKASKACHTAVNIPGGDALSRVEVRATTGNIGTLADAVERFDTTLKIIDPTSKGILEQEEFKTASGKTVYYLSYIDTYTLLYGMYIINDPESNQMLDGKPVVAYSVLGYTYNSALKGTVRGVVDSLETK